MLKRQAERDHIPAVLILLCAVLLLFSAGCNSASFSAPSPQVTATLTQASLPSPVRTTTTPSASPFPISDCLSHPGVVEEVNLAARGLPHTILEIMVYLPPCYAIGEGMRYPVLYLFHGQFYENDQWERLGVFATADRLIATGETPPFIIVLPYDPSPRQPSEYPFAEAITTVAVPYVDAQYLTLPGRAFRAVGGLSRGAGWSIHFGLTRPDLFGTVGAHSPIVLYEDGSQMEGWMKSLAPEDAPHFFLDIGDRDSDLDSALWFEGLLTRYGYYHEWHMYVGYHTEKYWAAHVEEYLRWYASNWDMDAISHLP